MAAPDEPAVDETAAPEQAPPTIAERLANFMDVRLAEHGDVLGESHGDADHSDYEAVLALAEEILRDFFRVDLEATSIYAIPGVDVETLEGFSMVHWGPMAGRVSTDELRAIGGEFVRVAEASDFDSAMVRWMLRDPGADREGVAKILRSFRTFRVELDVAEPEPEPESGE